MTPSLSPSPADSKWPPHLPSGERAVLSNISWDLYEAIASARDGSAPRLTYDDGFLEIEMLGRLHEQMCALVRSMVEKTLERQRIIYEPSGSTTWQRKDLLKGLEADTCYHIQSVSRVLGKSDLDLTTDPPPDLAIEVEITSPLLNKVEVYRQLRIPELWRLRADATCEMVGLDDTGSYHPIVASVAVPVFTTRMVSQYLLIREELGHSAAIQHFETESLSTIQSAAHEPNTVK